MKINIFFLLFVLFFFNQASIAELIIKVLNIEEKLDQFILLYMIIQNSFLKMREKIGFKKEVIDIVDNEVTIYDLDESYYAIAIYHDKNSNDEFDTFLSIPQEVWFSNDAKVFWGHQVLVRHRFFKKNQKLKIEIKLR